VYPVRLPVTTDQPIGSEQEDAASVHALQLSPGELQTSLDKLKEKIAWKPEHAGSDFLASQVAFFGIYDGSVGLGRLQDGTVS
jgi:hypothetical protein